MLRSLNHHFRPVICIRIFDCDKNGFNFRKVHDRMYLDHDPEQNLPGSLNRNLSQIETFTVGCGGFPTDDECLCYEFGMSISAMNALADKITDRLVEHFKREKIRKAAAKLDFLRRQLNEN
uniref:Uncharacterized protein n=1 Tax=Tetranychus urticae TaxID=32264 RepID=T1K187_TETUR